MVKVAIKSEKLSPFGGIFSIMELFDSNLSSVIDSTLGMRCRLYGYQYSEIIRSLMSVYFCGGSCIEAEKYDAKPTYKKFLGYRPGVAVIGDLIVGIENRRTKQEQRQSLLWLCLARRRKPKGQQRRQHKCPFPPEGHAEEVL